MRLLLNFFLFRLYFTLFSWSVIPWQSAGRQRRARSSSRPAPAAHTGRCRCTSHASYPAAPRCCRTAQQVNKNHPHKPKKKQRSEGWVRQQGCNHTSNGYSPGLELAEHIKELAGLSKQAPVLQRTDNGMNYLFKNERLGVGVPGEACVQQLTYDGTEEIQLQHVDRLDIQLPGGAPFVVENFLLLPFVVQIFTGNHLQARQTNKNRPLINTSDNGSGDVRETLSNSLCLVWRGQRCSTESSHHGDQEEVGGRDLLQVLRVSVSESFDVNQGQHHSAGRDARLSDGGGGGLIQSKHTAKSDCAH